MGLAGPPQAGGHLWPLMACHLGSRWLSLTGAFRALGERVAKCGRLGPLSLAVLLIAPSLSAASRISGMSRSSLRFSSGGRW